LATVKAFAAAGITNRVVAVLDNDTAAADALRTLSQPGLPALPAHIRVMQYPSIDLAMEYPTLVPPTLAFPEGSTARADMNGLAESVELYLGTDILTQEDGSFIPVQWTSFVSGMRRYQGEITSKAIVQERFREKFLLARSDPERIHDQDWT